MRLAVLTLLLLTSAHTAMAFPCGTTFQAGIDDNFTLTSDQDPANLDRGYIFLDDQDGGNQNQPGSPPAYTWEFLETGGNTTYYMARVQ